MPKSISKSELEALLSSTTKEHIAEQFGITVKSVTCLIRQYGLPNPPYVQSTETKQRRSVAVKEAHRRDAGLTERKLRGLRAYGEQIKGKSWDERFPPEQAAALRAHARIIRLGKSSNRRPRPEPRVCPRCGELLGSTQSGKKQQAYCKSCTNTYFKDYYRLHKEHYLELTNRNRRARLAEWRERLALLKAVPCQDCGETLPPYCMDFDHLDSAQKVAAVPVLIGNNASRERIRKEIAKTEVVCANCHRAREHARYLNAGRTPTYLSPRQMKNREIVKRAKSHPCRDCGRIFSAWQMDLDHVRGEKTAGVGSLVMSASTEEVLAELDKCEAVCAVCHRKRTFKHLSR